MAIKKGTQGLKSGQQLMLIDPETGAVATTTFVAGKKPYVLGEQWSTSTHAGMLNMANMKSIFNTSTQVLFWCQAHLTYGNIIVDSDLQDVTWVDAARDLGLTQSQVSNAVKKLADAGLLFKDKKRWRLHHGVAHFGSHKSLVKKREQSNVLHADFSAKKKIEKAIHAAIQRYEQNGFDIDAALSGIDDDYYHAAEAALVKIAIETGRMPDPWYEP